MGNISKARAERATAKLNFSKLNPVKVWVAATSFLVLTAALLPIAGMSQSAQMTQPLQGAKHYTCADGCMYNYELCINAGKGATYCLYQYQVCNANCGGNI
jgi:hypothetical protein